MLHSIRLHSRLAVLALSLASLGLGTLPGRTQAADLTAAEIQQILVGQSIHWWVEDSALFGDLMLAPDGSAEVSVTASDTSDTGQWNLRADTLCTRWSQVRGGEEKCYTIRRVAERRFVTSGGNVFELPGPSV